MSSKAQSWSSITATSALQGYEDGFFVGPHLFDNVTPDMDIYKQEIFGPVLSTVRAGSYEEAIGLAMDHEYGNGTAIFHPRR